MIADLKPYPAMKSSGVPWLGEVPEHWEVRRLRNAVDMRVRKYWCQAIVILVSKMVF